MVKILKNSYRLYGDTSNNVTFRDIAADEEKEVDVDDTLYAVSGLGYLSGGYGNDTYVYQGGTIIIFNEVSEACSSLYYPHL